MSYRASKERAVALRRKGRSVSAIALHLRLSKSTVANWCRSVPLTQVQQQLLRDKSREAGRLSLKQIAQKKRSATLRHIQTLVHAGKREVGTITPRERFLVGLALYWGEGYKNSSGEFGFTNSDPSMIRFYIRWLNEAYGVRRTRLILRVSINQSHEHRVQIVERYWKQITGVPLSQFSKTSLIRSVTKRKYPNEQRHFGTVRIKVRRGIDMRRKILGSIERLAKL